MFRWVFDPIARWLHDLVQWNLNVLHFLTWPGLLVLVVVVAARVSGIRAAIVAGARGVRDRRARPVGTGDDHRRADPRVGRDRVRARRTARDPQRAPPAFERRTRVLLDAMQVMPAFCYLLPCVLLFDIGYPPAVIATVIFALPAAIRLTHHGLGGVPDQLVEVGTAHGATTRQTLAQDRAAGRAARRCCSA